MARYTDSSCRLCRREGLKLFLKGDRCYSEKCAFERRGYAPGQHGQSHKKQVSDYGVQLREKQKLKRMYRLLEKQFRGYFEKAKNEDNDIYSHTQKYLNYFGENITFELIRTAYKTAADTVIIPMQDILNLGGEARMNFPGTSSGNWAWRFRWDQVTHDLANTYKELATLYERPPKPKEKEVELKTENS